MMLGLRMRARAAAKELVPIGKQLTQENDIVVFATLSRKLGRDEWLRHFSLSIRPITAVLFHTVERIDNVQPSCRLSLHAVLFTSSTGAENQLGRSAYIAAT